MSENQDHREPFGKGKTIQPNQPNIDLVAHQQPPVIDVHTHIVPPEVRAKREHFRQADLWFRRLYSNREYALADADDLLTSMTQSGLDASVAFGFAWRDPGLCRTNNDYVLERAAGAGGRIIPFCVVPPENLDFAAAEIERCRKMGAVGVGEIFPEGQGWNLVDGEKTRAFVDIAREFRMALTLHTSEPIGHTYAGKDRTTPRDLWSVIEATQGEIPIILAHWGGGLAFYELMPEIREHAQNVFYDSSASHLLYDQRVYELMTRLAPGRVLFGSDYPLIRQKHALRLIREATLSKDARASLLGRNAVDLGLEHPLQSPIPAKPCAPSHDQSQP